MAYSQHEWVNGEIITAEKLNNLEQGIADCGEREIEASAAAIVEAGEGEPSCDVEAKGSVSAINFKFAFKGIKGEKGDAGEAAPKIAGCEINIAGSVVSGKLSLSDGESVEIAGTYTAGDSGDSEPEGETPAEGGSEENPDSGEGETEPEGETESEPESEPEGETVQESGDSGDGGSGGGDED